MTAKKLAKKWHLRLTEDGGEYFWKTNDLTPDFVRRLVIEYTDDHSWEFKDDACLWLVSLCDGMIEAIEATRS